MDKTLPDKWIRKAIYDAFNDTVVDGKTIKVFDSHVPNPDGNNDAYVLMTVQSNDLEHNKCEDFWSSDITLAVTTCYQGTGNPGSRLLGDNILDALRDAIKDPLDLSGGGLTVLKQVMNFPRDLTSDMPNGTLFRKFLRLEMRIK